MHMSAAAAMTPAAMRIRARLREGLAEVQLLMPHPMETGMRREGGGEPAAAHHITRVQASVGDRLVFGAHLSIAMARDPLLTFRFRGARAGERLRVAWTDNRGLKRVDEAVIG